jgi:hypothetical protein
MECRIPNNMVQSFEKKNSKCRPKVTTQAKSAMED